jgi:hypothetical protein
MHPALRLIGERMPSVQARAQHLFERDEVFRELCDEYQCCSDATRRLALAAGADPALVNEYQALLLRLEAELLRLLAEHKDT